MAEKKPVAKKVVVKKVVAKKAATRKPKVSAALQLAQVAARAADEKQGSNITVLNVGDVLAITELFVMSVVCAVLGCCVLGCCVLRYYVHPGVKKV